MKKKLAIIGASYLQEPLIERAKLDGIETHVFAWKVGDVGEKTADFFYPISIIEKEKILERCQKIQIDGVCSIASDLAAIAVNYVASNMGLVGNSIECTEVSTNKHLMRERFFESNVPSPDFFFVRSMGEADNINIRYPAIVKPVDRSGSRGITKVMRQEELRPALDEAMRQSFEHSALIEEYVDGMEYSVESISWKGKHKHIALTQKYTTGSPHYIETGHLEPALLSAEAIRDIQQVVDIALDSLQIKYGASHSELKITPEGEIKLIEIGGRMGGDLIGSDLVRLSTGIDFVGETMNISLGMEPKCEPAFQKAAAIRFVLSEKDMNCLNKLKKDHIEYYVKEDIRAITGESVSDSSGRFGYFLMSADRAVDLTPYFEDL